MYPHHQRTTENLLRLFEGNRDVLAIILGGSVAKGLERPDSDVDAIVVITDERYADLAKENRLSECITEGCDYQGGYFDLKYCTKDYLRAVAERGSEPSRNAFVCAKCLFSSDEEITQLVPQIGMFQRAEKADKMLSFYSALALNHGYFWDASEDNLYLRIRAAADIVLFGYRLLLQDSQILFPCHKALSQTVMRMENKPEGIGEKEHNLLTRLDDESKKAFIDAILGAIDYAPPQDWSLILTRYINDNEQWWYKNRPVIAEW